MTQVIDSFRGQWHFLSNFSKARIFYAQRGWTTLKHAYQAMKFSSGKHRDSICDCTSAHAAKKLAHAMRDHLIVRGDAARLPALWRLTLMRRLIGLKFSPVANPVLSHRLERTGNAVLIEGNTWGDEFWGAGDGVGENWLGRILMEQRTRNRIGATE